MSVEKLKKRLSESGYDFRGAPDNYNESMRCENCQHFKRPYKGLGGKTHGNCSEIDLGKANIFAIGGELDVPGEYICLKYQRKPAKAHIKTNDTVNSSANNDVWDAIANRISSLEPLTREQYIEITYSIGDLTAKLDKQREIYFFYKDADINNDPVGWQKSFSALYKTASLQNLIYATYQSLMERSVLI